MPIKSPPMVSIGLPVYNAATYLQEALDALLAQDYPHFELIISDNASTDATPDICQAYMAKDARIRYYRNDVNLGANYNFRRVFDLSSNDYFMWAAHDDRWDPTYLRKCLERLERHPEAVLCCSEVVFLNEDGSIRTEWRYDNLDTLGKDLPGRVHELISRMGWYAIYGLIRSEAIRRAPAFEVTYGADVIYLLELLLQGDFVKVPEPLFYYRVPDRPKTAEVYLNDMIPGKGDAAPSRPHTGLAQNLLQLVLRQPLPLETKRKVARDFVDTLATQNADWRNEVLRENPALFAHVGAADLRMIFRNLLVPLEFSQEVPLENRINLLVLPLDDEALIECVYRFATTFQDRDAITLHVVSAQEAERVGSLLEAALVRRGLDPDRMADVSILSATGIQELPMIRAAHLVLKAASPWESPLPGLPVYAWDDPAWVMAAKALLQGTASIPPGETSQSTEGSSHSAPGQRKAESSQDHAWVPAGHFYSPLPSLERIRARESTIFAPPPEQLPGLDLRAREQLDLVERFKEYYCDLPYLPGAQPVETRYDVKNDFFSPGDAFALYGMIRHYRPKRIVEVGSGYSSAVILDTNERFFGDAIQCTLIEPYPERLLELIREDEPADITLYQQEVQDIPPEVFDSLQSGDILFVDSSHVSKIDSDVNHVLFNVLPRLAPGVLVHFHDILYPFEYPKEWIYEGRAWNEAYLLRAFLTNNDQYQILLFNSFLFTFHRDAIAPLMPFWGGGGSLWLRKRVETGGR